MTPVTLAKIILALIAAVLFGIGIRNDDQVLRWAAIAFLSAAVLLRFIDSSRRKR